MTRSHSRATRQTTTSRDDASEPAISPVGQLPGSYELKPNRTRRTNTARVSPLTLPPPAYTPGHRDADGARPIRRIEDHLDENLPTYKESVDPEPVPGYGTNDGAANNDVEAGIAQQALQQPRAVNQRQCGGYFTLTLMLFVLVGVFIYLSVSQWSKAG